MKTSVVWDPRAFRDHFEITTGNNIILSAMEKRKLDFYLSNLQVKKDDVLLDVGCGYGRFSKYVRDDVRKTIGIDINPDNVSYAAEYVGVDKFEGHVVDLSEGQLPFESNSIDKMVVDNVLMFLNEEAQKAFFKEARRVLKDHGVIVFNIYNTSYFLERTSRFFFWLYKLKAKLTGKKQPVHFNYSLSFYEKTLKDSGFTRFSFIGDTFYRKLGIAGIELFPKFLRSYIVKKDNKYFNSDRKKKMASLTAAATVR